MIRTLWTSVLELLLPAHCVACGQPAARDGRFLLCGPCGRAMAELIESPYCPRCGRTAGPYAASLDGCAACRDAPPRYDGAIRLGPYLEPLRSLILSYKYKRRVELGPLIGRLLAERVAALPWARQVDLVVPVPLHWRRRWWRGFNQAQGLAREIVRGLGGRLAARGLLRVRSTPHQTRLPASRRAANVRGAFAVRSRAPTLEGKTILLVDDVLTSGSTLAECARTLKKSGAAAVFVAVAAVAGMQEKGVW